MAVVGVRLQAFNWRMYEVRKSMGLTQVQLGQLCGLDHQKIGRIESLRQCPTREDQDEIASALNVEPSDLFPPEVLDLYGPMAASVRVAVPAERFKEIQRAGAIDPAHLVSGLPDEVQAALESLTPREQEVIRRRFGLGTREETFEEIARSQGVSSVRIQQIQAKAMRKLHHPSRAKRLVPFLHPSPDLGTRTAQGRAPSVANLKIIDGVYRELEQRRRGVPNDR